MRVQQRPALGDVAVLYTGSRQGATHDANLFHGNLGHLVNVEEETRATPVCYNLSWHGPESAG